MVKLRRKHDSYDTNLIIANLIRIGATQADYLLEFFLVGFATQDIVVTICVEPLAGRFDQAVLVSLDDDQIAGPRFNNAEQDPQYLKVRTGLNRPIHRQTFHPQTETDGTRERRRTEAHIVLLVFRPVGRLSPKSSSHHPRHRDPLPPIRLLSLSGG